MAHRYNFFAIKTITAESMTMIQSKFKDTNMITVRTKEELEQAIKNNKGESIRVEGYYAKTLAEKIRSKKKISNVAKVGGFLAIIGGALAVPFTGGASLAGCAAGAAAVGLTVGSITITTAELAMIIGACVCLGGYAISKGYKIKVGKGDSYLELDPK